MSEEIAGYWFQRGVEAYDRASGQARRDEIENACRAFETALTYLPEPSNFWADVHLNLGFIYLERLAGDMQDNLEKGREHLLQAREVYTEAGFPEEWARIQAKLGALFTFRLEGNPCDNIEAALEYCQNALTVFSRDKGVHEMLWPEDYPELYAEILLCEGRAYRLRIAGDPRRNWQDARHRLLQALAQLSPRRHPDIWGKIQFELGQLYSQSGQTNGLSQLERAIEYYQNVLEVFQKEDRPFEWGRVKLGIGACYSQLFAQAAPDQARIYRRCARDALQASLTVFAPDTYKREWAQAHLHLAMVSEGEEAIAGYRAALSAPPPTLSREEWAKIHLRLARLLDDPREQKKHLRQAQEIFKPLGLHSQACETDKIWGDVLYEQGQLEEALDHYHQALERIEQLRKQTVAEGLRRDLIGMYEPLFERTIIVSEQLDHIERAFDYVERSRARYLLDQLAESRVTMEQVEGYQEYLRLLEEVRALEQALAYLRRKWISGGDRHSPVVQTERYLIEALDESRQELRWVKTDLQQHSPAWFQESKTDTFKEIQQQLRFS
jgi:tetratricopeptide (TPR) repeat protein